MQAKQIRICALQGHQCYYVLLVYLSIKNRKEQAESAISEGKEEKATYLKNSMELQNSHPYLAESLMQI